MNAVGLALMGYAIGSIPFSFLVARLFGVKDVRAVGSGNVGATNVMRSAGKFPGALALVLHGLKVAATVWLARSFTTSEVDVCIAGLFIPLAPGALGAAIVVFVLPVAITRYVSLASILATLTLPAVAWWLGAGTTVSLTAVVAALMLVAKHHENSRLVRGVEPRLGSKR